MSTGQMSTIILKEELCGAFIKHMFMFIVRISEKCNENVRNARETGQEGSETFTLPTYLFTKF